MLRFAKQDGNESHVMLEVSTKSPELNSSVAADTVKKCKKRKKKKTTKDISIQEQEEAMTEDDTIGHQQLANGKRVKKRKHVSQTVTELEQSETEKKKHKKEIKTQPLRDSGVAANENDSSHKKRKKHKVGVAEQGMNSVLSKLSVDVPDITVPNETRKAKKKHKNRQAELITSVENQTISITADNTDVIDLHNKMNNGVTSLLTKAQENVKEKRKKKKVPRTNDVQTGPDIEKAGAHPTIRLTGTLKKTRSSQEKELSLEEWPELEELKQFIPNVELMSVLAIQQLITYDLERFKEFRSKGIELRSGRFSAEENEQLKTNVYDFIALTGISSPYKLFFPHRFTDEKSEIMKLKRQNKFLKRIAEGIPRLWNKIYHRGRKIFDHNNYKGRFTEDELHTLKKLHTLHGNSWSKISELTDRSTTALEARFSHISENAGRWTETELKRLMDAMQDQLAGQAETSDGPATIRKDKLFKEVPWKAVSERVKTRHWSQCREKWMLVLKQKLDRKQISFAKRVKSIQIKVHLIKELYELQVEDVADINWDELALKIGDVTPYFLQKRFYRLKLAKVPLWQNKTFCDIMDFLSIKVLPKYEDYLHKAGLDLESESRTEPQEFLVLSDIFNDLEDCDHDDLADE